MPFDMAVPFAIVGAVLGFAADLVARSWPAHEADYRTRPSLDWRTLILAVTGAVVFYSLYARWGGATAFVVILVPYVTALLLLLATDLDQRILPNLITLPLIAYTAAILVLGWSPLLFGKDLGLISGLAAGIGAPLILWLSDRILHGDLGEGDLKLAVSIGFMSGISQLIFGLLFASVGFSVVLLVLIAVRRLSLKSAVPFGPVLIFGAYVAVLLG